MLFFMVPQAQLGLMKDPVTCTFQLSVNQCLLIGGMLLSPELGRMVTINEMDYRLLG